MVGGHSDATTPGKLEHLSRLWNWFDGAPDQSLRFLSPINTLTLSLSSLVVRGRHPPLLPVSSRARVRRALALRASTLA